MNQIDDPSIENFLAIAAQVGFPAEVTRNALRFGIRCLLPGHIVRTVSLDVEYTPYQDLPLFRTEDPCLSAAINQDFHIRDRERRKKLESETYWALNHYKQLVDSGRRSYPHDSDYYAAEAVVLGTIAAIATGLAKCDGEGARESRDAVLEYYAATRGDQRALFLATGDNVFV